MQTMEQKYAPAYIKGKLTNDIRWVERARIHTTPFDIEQARINQLAHGRDANALVLPPLGVRYLVKFKGKALVLSVREEEITNLPLSSVTGSTGSRKGGA